MASWDSSSDEDKPSSSHDAPDGDWDQKQDPTDDLLGPAHWREEQDMVERAKQLSLADRDPGYYETSFSSAGQRIFTSQPDLPPAPTNPPSTLPNAFAERSPSRTDPFTASNESPLIWTNQSYTWEEVMQIQFNAELPKLRHDQSDTAVYIDPPPINEGTPGYHRICKHFESPHMVSSQDLKKLRSPKIEALFAPTAQFRTKRRLGNAGLNVHLGDEIKYYLDLRVPVTDEEALILIEGLTCSAGILAWAQAQNLYGIPKKFVCGQDNPDLLQRWSKAPSTLPQKSPSEKDTDSKDKDHKDAGESSPKNRKSNQEPEKVLNWDGEIPRPPSTVEESDEDKEDWKASEGKHDTKSNFIQTPNTQVEPPPQEEYCPLRHRSAIERLLHAASGKSPRLDSAPKMWTYFAIAKYFECADHPDIASEITVWLTEGNNSSFIQANPEVSYRIGMGIKSEHIVQTAFSILAAERALAIAKSPKAPATAQLASVHRTKVENLDDDEKNRVDHAANRFLHRITDLFHDLVDEKMQWLESVPECKRLVEHRCTTENETVTRRALLRTLKSHVRARIYSILGRWGGNASDTPEQSFEKVTKFYPLRKSLSEIYNELPCTARLLTRTFWQSLHDERWDENAWTDFDRESMPIPPGATAFPPLDCLSSMAVQTATSAFNATFQQAAPPYRPFHYGFQTPQGNWEWSDLQDGMGGSVAGRIDTFLPPGPFDDHHFFNGVGVFFRNLTERLLFPAHLGQGGFRLPTFLIDTLLCLKEDEFKYLPLWAGGFDDGETGAVFEEAEVPLLEAGGFAPGAGIHSADSAANSSTAGTDRFSDVASTAAGTVVGASHKATEGTRNGTASSEYDVVSVVEAEAGDGAGTEVGDMDEVWEKVKRESVGKGKGKASEMEMDMDMEVDNLMEDDNEDHELDGFDEEDYDDFDGFEDIKME